jgi:hypothetical protein
MPGPFAVASRDYTFVDPSHPNPTKRAGTRPATI